MNKIILNSRSLVISFPANFSPSEDSLALKMILSEGIIGVNWEGKGSYLKLGSSGLDITCFCMNVDDISCKRILENQKIYKLRFLINLTIV